MSDDLQRPDPQLPERPGKPNLNDLIEAFWKRRNRHTQRAYQTDLRKFCTFTGDVGEDGAANVTAAAARLLADQGTANHLALKWKESMLAEGLSPATINRRLTALRSMVSLANMIGMVPWELNVDNVPSETYRDTAGPGLEGFKAMLAALDRRGDTPALRRDRAMLHLLFGLALRRFEVLGLDMEDLDHAKKRIRITGKKRTQAEWLTAPAPVWAALVHWIEARGQHDGPLFTSFDPAGKGDGRLSGESLHRIVRAIGKSAGLKVWPHGLRHAAITTALDKTKGDLRSVQRFSRHKRMDTLMIYDDNRQDLGGKVADAVAGELGEPAQEPEDDLDDEGVGEDDEA